MPQTICSYIAAMLPYMLCALLPLVLFRYFWIKRLRRRGLVTTAYHEVGWLLFVVFLAGLASQTVIPKGWSGYTAAAAADGMPLINWTPFRVITETWRAFFSEGDISPFLINFLGNIVMFMPIGFFPPLLWRGVGFRRTLLIGFSSSLFIEICQLPQPRVSDIDDIWLNTLGAAAGLCVFMLVKRLAPEFIGKFWVRKKGEPEGKVPSPGIVN